MNSLKKLLIALLAGATFSANAFAVDATTNTTTDIENDIRTNQDSGVSLSGKAKIMPRATVTTGDNTATTDVRNSVETDSDAKATVRNRTTVKNKSYNRTRGKGHKYGHDKERDRN